MAVLEKTKLKKEQLLEMYASMHLVCIDRQETPNEKMSRYLLEQLGYIDSARARLGGKYSEASSQQFIDELGDYYHSAPEAID